MDSSTKKPLGELGWLLRLGPLQPTRATPRTNTIETALQSVLRIAFPSISPRIGARNCREPLSKPPQPCPPRRRSTPPPVPGPSTARTAHVRHAPSCRGGEHPTARAERGRRRGSA